MTESEQRCYDSAEKKIQELTKENSELRNKITNLLVREDHLLEAIKHITASMQMAS